MEIPLSEFADRDRFRAAATATVNLASAILGPATFIITCRDGDRGCVLWQESGDDERLTGMSDSGPADGLEQLLRAAECGVVCIGDLSEHPHYGVPPSTQARCFLGLPVTLDDGIVFGAVCRISASPDDGLASDVEHMRALARLLAIAIDAERSAVTDAMTGLATRALFDDHLALELARSRRNGSFLAVFVLGLEFPVSRDPGDQRRWMRMVGERLRSSLRQGDTIARVGATEFAVIVPDLRDQTASRRVAQSLLESLDDPYICGDSVLSITPSLGASLVPWDGFDPVTLVERAETAMETSRQAGGGSFEFYSEHRYLRVVPWE